MGPRVGEKKFQRRFLTIGVVEAKCRVNEAQRYFEGSLD